MKVIVLGAGLLALVVGKERPELEKQKADLTHQLNEYKFRLQELEAAPQNDGEDQPRG